MKKSKRILFVFILIGISSMVFAFEQAITTATYPGFLYDTNAWTQASASSADSTRTGDGLQGALLSWKDFRQAFVGFFRRNDNASFLSFRAPLNAESDGRKTGNARFSLFAGGSYHAGKDDAYQMLWYGADLDFNLGDRLFFDSNWWFTRYEGDLEYADSTSTILKGFRKNEDGRIYLDNLTGHIVYRSDYGDLTLGRDNFQVGESITGSVILSDAGSEYGYLSWLYDFGPVTLSFLHGSLLPDSTNNTVSYTSEDRYLAMHRLDWEILDDVNLFFGEEVLYGNRAPDISYMLPQTFYRVSEHNDGDRDNMMIFIGLSAYPEKLLGFYMNFVLDELKKSEIFGDWWGNKYAFQSGLVSNIPAIVPDNPARIVFEFTAIRPWMYTHKKTVNAFSHDGSALGYPEGSNLLSYALEMNVPVHPRLRFDGKAQFIRQGSLGNSWTINYNDRTKDTAKWLEGDLSEKWKIDAVATWKPLNHHAIKAGYRLEIVDEDDVIREIYVGYQAQY